jgi:hypothetical protein
MNKTTDATRRFRFFPNFEAGGPRLQTIPRSCHKAPLVEPPEALPKKLAPENRSNPALFGFWLRDV